MKFYNPFKPHITELRGKFYVRKLDLRRLSWVYADNDSAKSMLYNAFGWWSTMDSFSEIKTHEDAALARNNIPLIEAARRENAKVKVHL